MKFEVTTEIMDFDKILLEIDYFGYFIDFHNDYFCNKISLLQNDLIFDFTPCKINNKQTLRFIFKSVKISRFIFSPFTELTLVNLSRGKIIINNEIHIFDENGCMMFILEFDEYELEQEILFSAKEFWIEMLNFPSS